MVKTHTVRRFRADKTHSSGHSLLTQLPQGSPTTAALHLILRVLHGTQALLILGVDEARDCRGIGELETRKNAVDISCRVRCRDEWRCGVCLMLKNHEMPRGLSVI
jgi:hypothetical protein